MMCANILIAWPRSPPSLRRLTHELKAFLHHHVYSSTALEDDRRRSIAMMAELFQFFLDRPERLPDDYRHRTEAEPPHRLVCDYIAGMTDSFFHRTYDQMLGPTPPRS